MDNVVYLNRTNNQKKLGAINGVLVEHPETCYEYLLLCKKFLSKEDYEHVMHCILDVDYYKDAEIQIQDIVDRYQEFRV